MDDVANGIYYEVEEAKESISDMESELSSLQQQYKDFNIDIANSNGIISFSDNDYSKYGKAMEEALTSAGVEFEKNAGLYDTSIQLVSASPQQLEQAQKFYDAWLESENNYYHASENGLKQDIEEKESAIEASYAKMTANLQAWLQDNYNYQYLSDSASAIVDALVPEIKWNELEEPPMTAYDYQNYVEENIIKPLMKVPQEHKQEIDNMFQQLLSFKDGDLDVLDFAKQLQEKLNAYGIEIDITPIIANEQEAKDKLQSSIESITKGGSSDFTTSSGVKVDADDYKKLQEYTKDFNEEQVELWNKVTLGAENAEEAIKKYEEALKSTSEAANKTDISSFKDAWKGLDDKVKDKLLELAKAGKLTNDTFKKTEGISKFIEQLKALGISAEEAIQKINKKVDSSDQLSAMSSQISKMSDMLADKKNGVTADASDLAGFDVTVKGLDSWNEFERVMGSSTSTIAECKKAANALATEWVNSNNFLAQLTDENKDYYITQLNNMGVENAEAVVTAFLTKKREEEALATEYSNAATAYNSSVKDQNKKITTDLTNVTGVEIQRLKSEGIISADTAEKMRLLAVKKAMANGVTLNTTADIQNLADLAGASTKLGKLLNRLTDIKRGFTNGMPSDVAEIQAEDLQKQIEALINGGSNTPKIDPIKIDINGSSNYTPPKTTTSKDKTTKQKTKPTAQIFDFIETRLNKLTKAVEKAKSKIDELFNRKSKNNQIDKAIKATTDLINAQYKAAKKYQAYADKIAGKAKKTTKQTIKISDSTGKAIVSSAKKYVGKLDYVWGGSSLVSGADCSGFTQQIYKKNGINIARTAQEQYNTTKGTKITNKSKLKPGDLLYFGTGANNITHTGIYAGNGKFIHSPHKGKKVSISSLSDRKDFVGGVRANTLNKTTTKTYKVKGLSNSTVQKYIKLIENGSLDKDAIKSIKNDKLKQFIQDYSDYYQKAQEAIEKAKELEKERNEFKKDKLQNYVDEAQTYIDKYNTQIELAPGAVTKNNLEQKKLKYVKQLYDKQISIAKLEKDSLKVAQLRVEKEKELLEIKKEIRQNSLDQIDKDETLLDAQYKNATSTKSRNSILDKKNKQNDKKVTANKNYYNSVNKDFTSKGKTASKATTKAKSLSKSDRKKINSYIKQGKTIPKSLLNKVKSVDVNLYNSLVNYNKNYDDNSSIIKPLNSS